MIVTNTEAVRKYVGISADFDIAFLTSHLEWAEESYIPGLLGIDLYNKLLEYVASKGEDEFESNKYYEQLTIKVSRVICNIAVFDWLSVAGVSISDIGLHRIESEMGGSTRKSAFQYQEKDAKEFYRRKGFNSMDAVLQYIIANIDEFEEFKTSDNYKELQGDIIPDLKTFEKQYYIGNSYLLFIKLKPYIREAELFDLVPVIGTEFYNEIKSDLAKEDINKLLPELRSSIAYKAIARGIAATSINIVDDGARLIVKDSSSSNIEKITVPDLKNLTKTMSDTGDKYLGMLCENIRANIDKYPKYIDNRIKPIDNNIDNKLIVFL